MKCPVETARSALSAARYSPFAISFNDGIALRFVSYVAFLLPSSPSPFLWIRNHSNAMFALGILGRAIFLMGYRSPGGEKKEKSVTSTGIEQKILFGRCRTVAGLFDRTCRVLVSWKLNVPFDRCLLE